MGTPDELSERVAMLVCPKTKQRLQVCTVHDADARVRGRFEPRPPSANAKGKVSRPSGRTEWVLLREDGKAAYPVLNGIPILLATEALRPVGEGQHGDIRASQYAEVYAEMDFYNASAREEASKICDSYSYKAIAPALKRSQAENERFPHPKELWIDALYDCAGQWDAYDHLSPVKGKTVVELGGKGLHAVKMLLAGAAEGWVVSPMLAELLFAEALAEAAGVGERLHCAAAVAEELPIRSGSMDAIYSGGCLHHMQTAMALPEIARILRDGGRMAAVDPWRAPFYALGTKILGQREAGAYCKPLTKARVEPLWKAFKEARLVQHGTLTRYPLLALGKLGMKCTIPLVWRCCKIDDAVCSLIPGMRRMGSSAALLAVK